MARPSQLPRNGVTNPWRRPARYQPLVIVLAATVTGIVTDRYWPIPFSAWCMAAAMAWLGWLALRQVRCDRLAAVALLSTVATTAAAWHHLHWSVYRADDLGWYASVNRQPICIDAVVLTRIRVQPAPVPDPLRPMAASPRVQIDVAPVALRDRQRWRSVSGRARLTVYSEVHGIQVGDRVRILGQLVRPAAARNPGEFDYANYLQADRILAQLSANYTESISVTEQGSWFSPGRWLAVLRERCAAILRQTVPPAQSALAEAVLLGAREQIDDDEKQAFVETGTVHLLAISGLHVGILVGVFWFLLQRSSLPPRVSVTLLAALAITYMLLTDARPPVVRATVLVLVYCAAIFFGRPKAAFNSLAAAALVVLALNPADLFHTGAQLSFLAVAAVLWVAPLRTKLGGRDRWLQHTILAELPWAHRMLWIGGRAARHLLLVSLVIWCVTTPLAMARFHVVAPTAVPLNTVLCVPMTLALVGSFGSLLLAPLSRLLSYTFGMMAGGAFWMLQAVVDCAHRVPGSHFFVSGPAPWWLAGFYGSLLLLVAVPRLRPPRRWCVAMAGVWIAAGLLFPRQFEGDTRPMRCTYIALGHGLSVLVELPDGRAMLYDAGRMGPPSSGAKAISAVLWSRGITHLDAVFLSHGDLDHYNALPELLAQFSVGKIYVTPTMYENPNQAMDALANAIRQNGVEQETVWAGFRFADGDCKIEVLHPSRRGVLGSDNANSLVLAVEHAGHRILLTGDLESPGLDDLIAEQPLDCNVLLAPHHGGRRSNTPALARWCSPEWVVVSGAKDDSRSFQELKTMYETSGATVLSTAEQGAITIEAGREEIWATSYLRE